MGGEKRGMTMDHLNRSGTGEAARLETEHLVCRPLTQGDAQQVFALTSDPRVAEYMRFDAHRELGEARALIREETEGGNHGFLILEKPGGNTVGVFAFKRDEDGEEGAYSLTTFTAPAYWNRGYATELLAAAVGYARDALGAKKLRTYIVSKNAGSCRVCEKNGFALARTLYFDDLPEGLRIYERGLEA